MPFVVTRRTAQQRAARRRPRGLAEIQAAQTQYQEDVFGAQERLTGAQTSATRQYTDLTKQYESQLGQYRNALDSYNQRAADYASRVDSYINTINTIEANRQYNTTASLWNFSWMRRMLGQPERELRPVPAAPPDPGAFTEEFKMAAPQAPSAPSFTQDIQRFEQESDQARVRMEREVGERRSASMRARLRMTDRPMLSGE